ncbi:ParB N-terminal domain-containing protein [Leucobacter sp. HNU]|uniref:ParB N-terminal domain-containing protein n=1 Tax=Leucobacter sp. HNU TaxID=3236805 RepID=UPI003A80009B
MSTTTPALLDAEYGSELGVFDAEYRMLEITMVKIVDRQRPLDEPHVESLVESYARLGGKLMLQPVLVTHDFELIAGRHRLEAAIRSGWTHIPAMVAKPGLSREALSFIEFEEDRLQLQRTPLELFEGWSKYVEPVLRAEARLAMAQGGKGQEGARKSCTLPAEPPAKEPTAPARPAAASPAVSLREAAKEYTGLGQDALAKIGEVKKLAESETAPDVVRKAAQRSLKDLAVPGAKVEPAHRRVMQAKSRVQLADEDPRELERQRLQDVLDRVLKDSSLLAERMDDDLGSDLRRAVAGGDETSAEDIRSVCAALLRCAATAAAVVYEAEEGHGDASSVFFELGIQFQQLAADAFDSFGGAK